MGLAYPSAPSGRLVRLLDVAIVLWVAAWIVIGLAVAEQVRGMTRLSNTVIAGGRALQTTAVGLDSLHDIPFVGGSIHEVAVEVDRAGASAVLSGRDSRARTKSLSTLLGLSIAIAPTLPLVALYAPMRVSRVREVRAVRRALRTYGGDPLFEQFLARRATEKLPFHRLKEISENPWRDIELGHYRRLADAELARLGLVRPRSAPALVRTASSGGFMT